MRVTDKYVFFWGGPFSQWFLSDFFDDKNMYNCAEQYMMYHKAMLFGDEEIAKEVLQEQNPREHKKLGRRIKNFNQDLWNESKEYIVYKGNKLKFTQDPMLMDQIKKHRNKIFVEAAPNDRIWGIGLHWDNDDCLDESKWEGENLLGKALNKVQNFIFNNESVY